MRLVCFGTALASSLLLIQESEACKIESESELAEDGAAQIDDLNLAQVTAETENYVYQPHVNMVDNYRISVGGGPGSATGDFDVPGFMMSMSGIPGFDVASKLSGSMGLSFAMGDVAMQRLMTHMRAVGARAGMSGNSGVYKMAQTDSEPMSKTEVEQLLAQLMEQESASRVEASQVESSTPDW